MKPKLKNLFVTLALVAGMWSALLLTGLELPATALPDGGTVTPIRVEPRPPGRISEGHIGAATLTRPGPAVQGPFVGQSAIPKVSPKVGDLPLATLWQPGEPVGEVNPRQQRTVYPDGTINEAPTLDQLTQDISRASLSETPTVTLGFDGISFTGSFPPDPVGDVGPEHYVQMVNVHFAVYDKQGNRLAGPTPINTLWSGFGGTCETSNAGDPIVLYDRLANRWLLSQFTGSSNPHQCIAISRTPDPTGDYFLYDFGPLQEFNDYPKFGVWPDAYYMSTNESTQAGAYAFDRTSMLAGQPATYQRFTTSGNFMLPSDLDGRTPPPTGSPNYFYTMMDDTYWGGGPDRLEIWEYDVDFALPANSIFTRTHVLPMTSFDYTVCGFFVIECIPQPSPGATLDAISEWPMWRFQYRNFGTHESLVGNFTVDVDGTNHAGIRWFELRKTGTGNWSILQEGTHAPNAEHRWLGSIATDKQGNIALGYSVSSDSLRPSIRYATRLANDPLGSLASEMTLVAGGGVQTAFHRWGDYSSMNVDPMDDCTFWYTNEYFEDISTVSWRTRIGAFRIPSCISPRPEWDKQVYVNHKPVTDIRRPIPVGPNDSVQIVDRVAISYTQAISFTLNEAWTGAFQLIPPATHTVGQVISDANWLSWDATGVMTDAWHVLTKTFQVNDSLGWSDFITETLMVEGGPDPIVLPLEFVLPATIAKRGPDKVSAGDVVSYTLVVTSSSPLSGTFALTDVLPAGVSFAGALATTYGTAWYSDTANAVYWTGDMMTQDSALVSAVATATFNVAVTAAPGSVVTNTAELLYQSVWLSSNHVFAVNARLILPLILRNF